MHKKYILFFFFVGLWITGLRAQWVQTGGPFGGLVNDFAQNGSHIFAGTATDGVYTSTDGGVHWAPANTGLPGPIHEAGLCFAVKGSQVFVGMRSGVYVTSDNGALWTSASNGIEDRIVYKLLVKGDTLFAATNNGVLRSANNGASWQEINTGLPVTPQLPSVYAMTQAGNRVFVGTLNGVFYTDNNGNNWSASSTGLSVGQITALYNTGSVLLAAVTGNRIFVSTNNGATWAPTSGISSAYILSISKAGGKLFACSANEHPYVSVDGGYTWARMASVTPGGGAVTVFETGSTLLAATSLTAVCASPDSGNTWVTSNDGITLNTTFRLAVNGNRIFAASPSEAHSSTDNGDTWTRVMQGGWRDEFTGFAFSGTHTFMSSARGVYVSPDNGATWTLTQNGLNADTIVYALAYQGNTAFAAATGRLYRSSDNGAHWVASNLNRGVRCMAVLGNTLFAGTLFDGLFASSDNGNSWSVVTTDSIFEVYALAVQGNALVMANSNGVFRSADNGVSWNDISPISPDMLSIQYLAVSGNVIFVGGPQGDALFASVDNGLTWADIRGNLPSNAGLRSLTTAGNFLFAGIDGFSVWRMALGTMEVAEPADAFAVQVGPNPFSDLVYIRLPQNQGAVSLLVTDMTGKTVAHVQAQGTELVWNRAAVAAGTYLFRIGNAKGEQVVRRVVIY